MIYLFITKAYAVDLSTQYGFAGPKTSSIGSFVSTLLPLIFGIVGIVVMFYFLFAAFKFITSAGDKNALAQAKYMITHSIIGIILLVMLFSVLQFIPSYFGYTGFTIFK